MFISAFLPQPCFPLRTARTARTTCAPKMQHATSGHEDFPRDYFPELKALYSADPHVRIFSRDDYKLDDEDTSWMHEYRGRDLSELRANMQNRPVQPDELSLPGGALRQSDMISEPELSQFQQSSRDHDPASGRVWQDPMPESDFELDDRWLHLRHISDQHLTESQQSPETTFADLPNPPPKRVLFDTEEQQIAHLKQAADDMQAQILDQPLPRTAFAHNVPVPSDEDFNKWQRAAQKRGGNATQNESNFLSPVCHPKDVQNPYSTHSAPEPCDIPHQHDTLVDTHTGVWSGLLYVYAISPDDQFDVNSPAISPIQSEVEQNGSCLHWTTTVSNDSGDFVSSVPFSNGTFKNALVPGRTVSENGHYVTTSLKSAIDGTGMSLSDKFLKSLSADRHCEGVLEVSIFLRGREDSTRARVVLCKSVYDANNAKAAIFSHVLLIVEQRQSSYDTEYLSVLLNKGLATTEWKDLQGCWKGKGISFHPQYPPLPYQEISTSWSLQKAEQVITTSDVSWVEDDNEQGLLRPSKRRQKTVAKKKLSKRVRAAIAHDNRRLSECTMLLHEQYGEQLERVVAWKSMPNAEVFNRLFSPRIGRFVHDYCGLVLPNSLIVTFPFGTAMPTTGSSVNLIELGGRERYRICVGRNGSGELVGVLFINEDVYDDSVEVE